MKKNLNPSTEESNGKTGPETKPSPSSKISSDYQDFMNEHFLEPIAKINNERIKKKKLQEAMKNQENSSSPSTSSNQTANCKVPVEKGRIFYARPFNLSSNSEEDSDNERPRIKKKANIIENYGKRSTVGVCRHNQQGLNSSNSASTVTSTSTLGEIIKDEDETSESESNRMSSERSSMTSSIKKDFQNVKESSSIFQFFPGSAEQTSFEGTEYDNSKNINQEANLNPQANANELSVGGNTDLEKKNQSDDNNFSKPDEIYPCKSVASDVRSKIMQFEKFRSDTESIKSKKSIMSNNTTSSDGTGCISNLSNLLNGRTSQVVNKFSQMSVSAIPSRQQAAIDDFPCMSAGKVKDLRSIFEQQLK